VRSGSPRSDLAAATYTGRRAASSVIAMSAIMNWSPRKSAMRLPNCWRTVTLAEREVERPLRDPDSLGANRDASVVEPCEARS
jgi:hypothetical protein